MLASLAKASPSAASSPARQVAKYLLVAPDYTDEGALQRRLDVRARHLEAATTSFKDGLIGPSLALLHASRRLLPADRDPLPSIGQPLGVRSSLQTSCRPILRSRSPSPARCS